jgi:methionine sulfoxide reductase catalytic subunit
MARATPAWRIPEREATPESVYLSRRTFLAGALAMAACAKLPRHEISATIPATAAPYPVPRNKRFTLDRPLTDELTGAAYNNFYEISPGKDVWRGAGSMAVDPWSVEVTGLVAKPRRFSLEELLRILPLEERLYRHRCVEAWSMAVPWSGFPLARLLALAEPAHAARYVRFISLGDATRQPAIARQAWYPWPYQEALRMDEAMHELTFVATGIYGHALPKQHGAPVRLVVPWKYGYKSAKSIVRIELVAERPRTFWETVAPVEYPFESNVDPFTPHPRWSQATEKLLGTLDVRRTLPYNGYASFVKQLYI